VKHQNDPEAARHTLQQIIVRFPNSAVAQNAATRLAYMGLETRRRQASQTIKLGSYEKDLGLKKRP
jgi:outer membrane protein assembly factor BamD (BamD/ComL family)